MPTETRTIAKVYFVGDPEALWVDLVPEQVLALLREANEAAAGLEFLAFVSLPLTTGEIAYARPSSVAVVVPHEFDPEDD